jgi:dihydroorotate dehydrogenase
MTPNVGDPTAGAKAAIAAGADGISAINTILSVVGLDPKTLRPMPTVEGYTVPGGYSGQAVRPIALRHCMEIARAIPGVTLSGMGGIETGWDAAQFMLLGSSTVQVCTGAMLKGYDMVTGLKAGLEAFLVEHGFGSLRECVGKSLPYFSTHADLVERQRQAKVEKAGKAERDNDWKGEIKKETDALVAN